jgi:outer membrane autotransporter protein
VTPGLKFYALGDYFSENVARSDQTSAFDVTGGGGTIGADYGIGMGAIGIAGNYSKPRVRFGTDSARINAHSWQVGAYGSLDAGGLFGQAYVGYGRDHNRITRMGVVEDMSASPRGSHVTAGAKGGYLMAFGPARIGPVAALDYAKVKVDGYTETGDPVLMLDVSGQSVKSLTGQVGIEVRGDSVGFRPYASLTAEHEFSGDSRAIRFAETAAPVIVNSWDIDRDKETYARAAVGASATLMGGVSVDAAATTTFGRDGGQEMGGHVGVRASF